jgi:hypothetical protein
MSAGEIPDGRIGRLFFGRMKEKFLAQDGRAGRSLNAQPNAIAPNLENLDDNLIVNDNSFTNVTRQHKHGGCLLPETKVLTDAIQPMTERSVIHASRGIGKRLQK